MWVKGAIYSDFKPFQLQRSTTPPSPPFSGGAVVNSSSSSTWPPHLLVVLSNPGLESQLSVLLSHSQEQKISHRTPAPESILYKIPLVYQDGVRDQELLAIKWALEEWQHWLLGAKEQLLIWTNHQNLIHIQTAKQLNPTQAL